MSKVRDILGPDRDSEFLQSFVRVGVAADEEDDAPYKSVYMQQKAPLTKQYSEGKSEGSEKTPRKGKNAQEPAKGRRKKQRDYIDEIYTDKDRAAAVSLGSYDIKQSLSIKRRQDRTEALQLPDDSDPAALYEMGLKELKNGNTETAISLITKALELNPSDHNALVARSKCYLLLGDPAKGLQDAETALTADKTNIRAIYQKAESLYFLGQFEHSLMYFHRGLRLRPELTSFRLGIQKSQEAIEKTIGGFPKKSSVKNNISAPSITTQQQPTATQQPQQPMSATSAATLASPNLLQQTVHAAVVAAAMTKPKTRPRTSKADADKREAKKLLGELCVDKEYLQNLLKHPNLKRADTGSENISNLAKDAVQFLNTRQEFWRQQRPCTAIPNQKKKPIEKPFPKWY